MTRRLATVATQSPTLANVPTDGGRIPGPRRATCGAQGQWFLPGGEAAEPPGGNSRLVCLSWLQMKNATRSALWAPAPGAEIATTYPAGRDTAQRGPNAGERAESPPQETQREDSEATDR